MILVKDRERLIICTKAIGDTYWNAVGEVRDVESFNMSFVSEGPASSIIVRESDRSWLVTLKGQNDGVKVSWVRCSTLSHAQRMSEHAQ